LGIKTYFLEALEIPETLDDRRLLGVAFATIGCSFNEDVVEPARFRLLAETDLGVRIGVNA
jgi:hypothetical protein